MATYILALIATYIIVLIVISTILLEGLDSRLIGLL